MKQKLIAICNIFSGVPSENKQESARLQSESAKRAEGRKETACPRY